jgi:hypothetical protein
LKEHLFQDLLDAASSSRRHQQKPRKSRSANKDDPEAIAKEPISAKSFGPGLKLNILTRFWRSRVGQPWDSLWREEVAALSGNPDLLDQVKRHVGAGRKWQRERSNEHPQFCWIYGGRAGLNQNYQRDIVFFVCPQTACLMLLPRFEFHSRYGTAGSQVPLTPC